MTDAEYAEAKRRIELAFYRWRRVLGFVYWECTIVYERDGVCQGRDDERFWAAKCDADWRYLRLQITANVPYLGTLSDRELDGVIIHEYCHALVNEIREVRTDWLDHEERVCTQLAQAIRFARCYGEDPAQFDPNIENDIASNREDSEE